MAQNRPRRVEVSDDSAQTLIRAREELRGSGGSGEPPGEGESSDWMEIVDVLGHEISYGHIGGHWFVEVKD